MSKFSDLFRLDKEAQENGEEFYSFKCGDYTLNVVLSTDDAPMWFGEIYTNLANPAIMEVGAFDTALEAMDALEKEFEPTLEQYHALYQDLNEAPF